MAGIRSTACVALVTGASRGIGAAAADRACAGSARTSSSPRAPRAAWRKPTTRSAPSAARRRSCRWICARARQIDAIGPTPVPALRPAGHPGAQRRSARPADPGGAHPAGRLGRCRRGEPVRRLAADPHLRSAAAPGPGRPRRVRHRKPGAGAAGLLGRHGRDQGGDGAPGADLGAGGRHHAGCGSTCSIPARWRPACAPMHFPARTPPPCRRPRRSPLRWPRFAYPARPVTANWSASN